MVMAISAYYSVSLASRRSWAQGGLVAIVALLALPLLVFKYSEFFLESIGLDGLIGVGVLTLPLAISFYTFQNISYVVGNFNRSQPAAKDLAEYLAYLSFFPQLVAGPIVTARDFLPQIRRKLSTVRLDFTGASFYLLSGYIKKAVFADHLATVADPAFANPNAFSGAALVVAVLAYTLQIYFDFSGYSDIAIGTARLFGIRLPENFNFPYSAVGFRDFWRRWHITLSTWLRDHLYIPLGGSRSGLARLVMALLVTMTLGGLWHGAHWNFVLWGAAHGALLIIERPVGRWVRNFQPRTLAALRPLGVLATFCLAALLWIPFRTGAMEMGFERSLWIYRGIFTWQGGAFSETGLRLVVFTLGCLLLASFQYGRVKNWFRRISSVWAGAVTAIASLLIFAFAAGGGAFIYFIF